jgi:crotonobetainyl-CoA:carnitine CoA-transferase CaiB-like acyl-CoA transferase
VPYEAFQTSDGHIILAVGNDGQFARFCEVAGRRELADDERFATNPSRVDNRGVLIPLLGDLLRARSSADWLAALEKAGVPCGPINDIEQLFADPQVKARGLQIAIPDPDRAAPVDRTSPDDRAVPDDRAAPDDRVVSEAGTPQPGVASPIHFSKTPIQYELPPPRLGQHTDEVLLEELGLDAAELERLRASGVIGG